MRLLVVELSAEAGLLHYAVQLADALAGQGHSVDLLVPRGNELAEHPGAARRRALLDPGLVGRSPAPRPGLSYQLRRCRVATGLTKAWTRVVWESWRGGHDALIVGSDMTISVGALGALVLTALPRPPTTVHICHNVRPYDRWGGQELFLTSGSAVRLLRTIYPRFDLVLVHGERSRAEFEATWPATRLEMIPMGDQRLFASEPPAPSDEERVLFFGDWRKVKGLPVLMGAFDRLANRRGGARLTIAGRPAPADLDPDGVRRWAVTHGDRVEVMDRYIPRPEVSALFARARVVVTPYLAASQSAVVHMAMTMARAVVASDVGDLGAVVRHEESGLLVPAGDPGALSNALERVLADPALANRMGSEGRRQSQSDSSWEAVAKRVESVLSPVVSRSA